MSASPPPSSPSPSLAPDELWKLLRAEKAANAQLQKQVEDERRLRFEAEDIIDLRQDEVAERDAELRRLREELQEAGQQQFEERQRDEERQQDGEGRKTPPPGRSDLAQRTRSALQQKQTQDTVDPHVNGIGDEDEDADDDDNNDNDRDNDDKGTTAIVAGYAGLVASVKAFVEHQLAPVFSLELAELDAAAFILARAATAGGNVMAQPRSLLKLMNPRAHMFLRLRGADSVHFNAILLEFLRRNVFAELYGGIFGTAAAAAAAMVVSTNSKDTLSSPTPCPFPAPSSAPVSVTGAVVRGPSRIGARLADVERLAAHFDLLLSTLDADSSNSGSGSGSGSGSSIGDSAPPSASSPRTAPAPALSHSPVPIHREASLLRARLVERVLGTDADTAVSALCAAARAPDTSLLLQSPPSLAALHRAMEDRVVDLSAVLTPLLLPLRLILAEAQQAQQASMSAPSQKRSVLDHGKVLADLQQAVCRDLVRPAVLLAVQMQLVRHVYEVRWVEHRQDSPSLSVCEALGMDYKRIRFGLRGRAGHRKGTTDDSKSNMYSDSRSFGDNAKGKVSGSEDNSNSNSNSNDRESDDHDERHYSFVFDVSPALFVTHIPLADVPVQRPALLYAQGVLLQKGEEVPTDKTFVHWLYETGRKTKAASSKNDKHRQVWR
ncbi:MAG: hypothetical protein STHCBS139747_005289 [Sporothrix thermara]